MKKIFGVLVVRNEGDIIESCLRYNLSYLDGVVICEGNRSYDNTAVIINKLIEEGLPIYWADFDDSETKQITDINDYKILLAHIAIDKYCADLVLSLDADEFLYHIDGINPRETLEALRYDVEYHALWRTYMYEKEPDIKLGFMPNNFTRYRNPVIESPERYERHRKVIASKYLLKNKQATFIEGAHFLRYPQEHQSSVKIEIHDKLVFAHFPVRSKSHVMRKVIPNYVSKWKSPHRMPVNVLDAHQLGILFHELKDFGEITQVRIMQHSLEYSMMIEYKMSEGFIFFSREEIDELKANLGDALTIAGPMDVSFCADKLGLRYTDYSEDNKVFMRTTLEQIYNTLTFLSEESDNRLSNLHKLTWQNNDLTKQNDFLIQQINDIAKQNDFLIQQSNDITKQNDFLIQQNNDLTKQNDFLIQQSNDITKQNDFLIQHNNDLTKQNDFLIQQNNDLTKQISDIFSSNTWKIGKKIQKTFRLFVPFKK